MQADAAVGHQRCVPYMGVARGGGKGRRAGLKGFVSRLLEWLLRSRKRDGEGRRLKRCTSAPPSRSMEIVCSDSPLFHVAFRQAIAMEDVAEEGEGASMVVVGGGFAKGLKVSRLRGKPLLAMIINRPSGGERGLPASSSDSKLWAALTDKRCATTLREAVVAWGAWSDSPEAAQAFKRMGQAAASSGERATVALIRPLRGLQPSSFAVLGKYAGTQPAGRKIKGGREGKASSSASAKRLQAWLESTLSRYQTELAADARLASDRAIVQEVEQGFKSGLQADLEREERTRREAAAAASEAAAAAAAAKAEAEVADRDRRRRQALRDTLGPEPPKLRGSGDPPVCTVAVRLPDGTRQQRRFASDCTVGAIFDWLDSYFELDADTLRLKVPVVRGKIESNSCEVGAFTCNGRGEAAVVEKTLQHYGFHERPVLLLAESPLSGGGVEE